MSPPKSMCRWPADLHGAPSSAGGNVSSWVGLWVTTGALVLGGSVTEGKEGLCVGAKVEALGGAVIVSFLTFESLQMAPLTSAVRSRICWYPPLILSGGKPFVDHAGVSGTRLTMKPIVTICTSTPALCAAANAASAFDLLDGRPSVRSMIICGMPGRPCV